ncbi:hypothetical protein E3A20_21950 [Planctomyces bekefii]|uniref:Uncharacterized protein n=1 Tax=Planctomyces bekefii TaxID=1653850 RepID=A0A5C6M3H6_9PLAN|nr:hypothetical protein E3A20_21950 [Planctomyces bekefii]
MLRLSRVAGCWNWPAFAESAEQRGFGNSEFPQLGGIGKILQSEGTAGASSAGRKHQESGVRHRDALP